MRRVTITFTILLAVGAPLRAQEWIEYQNNEDGFKVNFPGPPKITESWWST